MLLLQHYLASLSSSRAELCRRLTHMYSRTSYNQFTLTNATLTGLSQRPVPACGAAVCTCRVIRQPAFRATPRYRIPIASMEGSHSANDSCLGPQHQRKSRDHGLENDNHHGAENVTRTAVALVLLDSITDEYEYATPP